MVNLWEDNAIILYTTVSGLKDIMIGWLNNDMVGWLVEAMNDW
jgi:hypothetical protein